VLVGFTPWLVVNLGSGDTTLTGWGTIGGGDAGGQNINDYILQGGLSYRPALLPTALAGLAVLAGLRLLFARSKIAAAGAIACGGFLAIWGGYSALSPSTVGGVLDAGESRSSIGPWLVLVAGLVVVGAGLVVILGRASAPTLPAAGSRGIQHPR
jgi:hypothetical protein